MKALKKARTEVDKAADLAARWEDERATRQAELADLEGRVGQEALDGGPDAAERLARRTADLRAAVQIAGDAAAAARTRHEQARRALLRYAADVLAEQATAKHGECDRHEERTAELLAELQRHDGADYVPWEPRPDQLGPGDSLTFTPSKGKRLRAAARRLDERADAIRRLADAKEVNEADFDAALAEVDPHGPEAQRMAAREAQQARELEAARARRREETKARREQARERKQRLRVGA